MMSNSYRVITAAIVMIVICLAGFAINRANNRETEAYSNAVVRNAVMRAVAAERRARDAELLLLRVCQRELDVVTVQERKCDNDSWIATCEPVKEKR